MQKREEYKEKGSEPQEMVELGDLVNNSTKLNVNAVEATELALLPGVNIIMAKKIIEYRNKNGDFKSVDEFLSVANVKEHFVPKIRQMVEIGKSKNYDPSSDDYEQGRIVDF
jgi:competence protein ComEA